MCIVTLQRGKDLVLDLLTEKELEQIQQKGPDFMGKQTNEYGTPIGGGQFNQNPRNFGAQNEVQYYAICDLPDRSRVKMRLVCLRIQLFQTIVKLAI